MERSPGQRQPHLERWGSPRWLHRRRHARKVSTNAMAASETSLRLEDAVDGTTGSVLTDNEGTTVDEELLTFDLVGQRNPPQDEHRAVRPRHLGIFGRHDGVRDAIARRIRNLVNGAIGGGSRRQLLLALAPEAIVAGEVDEGGVGSSGDIFVVRNTLGELRTTSKQRRAQQAGEPTVNASTVRTGWFK